ncbi:MAG TPA: TIR domain-containing protein [Pyrinomonadaceae bacterium]|nr:TIR domain-containing protein [Pyrinomonadaceae bacterium]
MEDANHKFDVFLSYSRKDEEFGKRLEEALENYALPKDVQARSISKKRLNVFRDRKDLVPTRADYYEAIEEYLKQSRYLVVICSPNARASEYVNAEIETYLRSHPADRVIPVLLSGKPNNDREARPEEYAFPQALCNAAGMPLAVEFTEFQRAPGKLNKGRYHDSWFTLLSKIFGTERAEIERLDAKRQARRRAIFVGVSLAVIAALSVALLFAIIARQQAASERDHAQQLLYASDMNLAQRAFESGNVGLGKTLLESHRPKSGEQDLRGFEWYYLWQLYNGQLASFDSTDDFAFSRDGSSFATVTGDAIKIWDTASRRETANIALGPIPQDSNDNQLVTLSIDFSPDGNTIAYGDNKRGTRLFDLASGASRIVPFPILEEKQRRSLAGDSEESMKEYWQFVGGGGARFSPDGKILAVTYECGVVAVFDANSLTQITALGEGRGASDCTSFVTFSPDGKLLAYGSLYNLLLWDTVTHTNVREPEKLDSEADSVEQVESVAFSPDSRMLAIGDRSKQVVLWAISTRKVLARLKGHEGWVSALAFSPDGKTLYSGSVDQTVKLWDLSSFKTDDPGTAENITAFATLKGHTGSIVSIKCAADGKTIATMGKEHTVNLWANTAGKEFEKIDDIQRVFPESYLAIKSSGDGDNYTITALGLGVEIKSAQARVDEGPMAVSPDQEAFALETGGFEDSKYAVQVVDPVSGREFASIPSRNFPNSSFSHDNRLFCAIGPDSKSVMIWDRVEKKELSPIKNDVELQSYLISRDSKVILTIDKDDGNVTSWDVASQRQMAQLVRKPKPGNLNDDRYLESEAAVLSPDGQWLAFSDSTKIALWQVNSGNSPIAPANQEMRERVSVIAFSPDGKFLAAGDEAGTVRIWDAATRQELGSFMGHKDIVTTLAFSADGRTLASGGAGRDGVVKLYGLSTMRELLTLRHEPSPPSGVHAVQGNEDAVTELLFSADGKALITHSGNLILRIWRANTLAIN